MLGGNQSRMSRRHDKQPGMCHHMVLKLACKSVDHFWSIHQAKRKQTMTHLHFSKPVWGYEDTYRVVCHVYVVSLQSIALWVLRPWPSTPIGICRVFEELISYGVFSRAREQRFDAIIVEVGEVEDCMKKYWFFYSFRLLFDIFHALVIFSQWSQNYGNETCGSSNFVTCHSSLSFHQSLPMIESFTTPLLNV